MRSQLVTKLQPLFDRIRLTALGAAGYSDLLVTVPDVIAAAQFDPIRRFIPNITPLGVRHVLYDRCSSLKNLPSVRRIWLQSFWNTDDELLNVLIDRLRDRCPRAKLIFCDWWAPVHFPKPNILGMVDAYLKKHVLRDLTPYATGFHDTNLVEYESQLSGKYLPPKEAGVDLDLLKSKLILGWNFAASDSMMLLLNSYKPDSQLRTIDVHCRMAAPNGDGWYSHMRRRALAAVNRINTFSTVAQTTRINHKTYLGELQQSKVCFSPFGYGEVCWRDFEAVACGAVLIKPNMDHVVTKPNIYSANSTYIPVRWDFSDLEDQLNRVMKDAELREFLTANARKVWLDYLAQELPADREHLVRLGDN
jgi:hypothetical protein